MHDYSMLLERRRKCLVLYCFFSRSWNESFLDKCSLAEEEWEERVLSPPWRSNVDEEDRGGRPLAEKRKRIVLSPPKCSWPRRKMTGERDRWPRGGRGSVLSPPKCFGRGWRWPRRKSWRRGRLTGPWMDVNGWAGERQVTYVSITNSPRIC